MRQSVCVLMVIATAEGGAVLGRVTCCDGLEWEDELGCEDPPDGASSLTLLSSVTELRPALSADECE